MQRYISIDRGEPPCVRMLLIWKDTELPDEATLEHALEVFKLDFAELLDLQSVRNIVTEAIVHT